MRRTLSLIAAVASIAAATAPAASAHDLGTRVVGHVYVNDNTSPVNTIAGYDRHADGTLTPIPGSPFATGGSGTGAPTGSQGALQEVGGGRYLLAVDAGSNQISVLRVRDDGALAPVPGGTVASGGDRPVSIAVHRRLVYVANAGAGDADYTGFVFLWGHLWPLPGTTVSLPADAQPGDVLFNATGRLLAGTRVGTSQIDSFSVGFGGRLTPAPGSPFTAQGPGPFGSEFSPVDPSQLFVSNAHGGAGNGTVSAFSAAPDGTLSAVPGSPFANGQTAPCWVEISHDGRFLFAVNTASASISSYRIAPSGNLSLIANTAMRDGTGLGPFDARLSPDGGTLWVVDDGGDAVSGFRVSGGTLTELGTSPSPLPAGASPFGIVVS